MDREILRGIDFWPTPAGGGDSRAGTGAERTVLHDHRLVIRRWPKVTTA